MEPFAVVGLSFKMPQEAVNESSLWEVLEQRKNLMTTWPEDRAVIDSFHDRGTKNLNTMHARGAHFLRQDPGLFDAPFFSITAKEAAAIDPQHRLSLEAAYHAFESAGMTLESMRGSRTAVFAASMTDDYSRVLLRDADVMPRQTTTGIVPSMLPNRISWFFDLRGPSLHLDTACSSSMIALDMACQSMRNGDASAALVIGTNLVLGPEGSIFLSNMNFLSPDSKCFCFDARANGYARGEGVIALVIKPLDAALRNGDVIRAVVRATASNQDGRTPGVTQPSAEAQEALIRRVYAKAGLGFAETRYFEAHGTGTPVGDPIEMTAIGRVFGTQRSPTAPLYVGSIKANVGHLEGASGLVGVVKAILVLEKGIVPPNALFETINPDIAAEFYNLEACAVPGLSRSISKSTTQVPTRSIAWPSAGLRRVSVNSFGFGGANSHVVLDDALHYLSSRALVGFHHTSPLPAMPINGIASATASSFLNGHLSSDGRAAAKLLIWTAADAAALQRLLQSYATYCQGHLPGDAHKLAQLAYTLAAKRSIMAWRSFAVLDDGTASDDGHDEIPPRLPSGPSVRASTDSLGVAFIFTGQGAQYSGMGLELTQRYPVYAESLRRSDAALAGLGCEWSIFDQICNEEMMNRPELSQPLSTALQIALVDLLRSLGVEPVTVVGHSGGETAAAYAVGALNQSSACKVAYFRGKLAGKLVDANAAAGMPGAMMSINLAASDVPALLGQLGSTGKTVHIACFNSPTNVTLSGPVEAIDELKVLLERQGVFAAKLNTGLAYHSPAMQAMAADYGTAMGQLEADVVEGHPIPMISSVTSDLVTPKVLATAQYWVENLLSPVRFADALRRLVSGDGTLPDVVTDLVEIGPHGALRRPARDCVPAAIRYYAALDRNQSPVRTVLSLVGALFCQGHDVSVLAVNNQAGIQQPFLVDCPPYPFDHSRRYWFESRLSRDFRLRRDSPNYLLGRRSSDWNALRPRWRNWLSVERIPWLEHHAVSQLHLCPGTGLIVMAVEAAKQMAAAADGRAISGFLIKEAKFLAPVTVGKTVHDATETEVHLRPLRSALDKDSTWSEVGVFTHHEGRWTECFRARIQVQFNDDESSPIDGGRERRLERTRAGHVVERMVTTCSRPIDTREFYAFCANHGIHYGKTFELLSGIRWDGDDGSVASIDMAAAGHHYEAVESPVHPAVLDAGIHLVFTQISEGLAKPSPAMVPHSLSNLWISSRPWHEAATMTVSASLHSDRSAPSRREAGFHAVADDGAPLLTVDRMVFSEVSSGGVDEEAEAGRHDLLYSISWRPQLSSLLGDGKLQRLCDAEVPAASDEAAAIDLHRTLEAAMRMAVRRAMTCVSDAEIEHGGPPYLRKYAASLRQQYGGGGDRTGDGDEAFEALLRRCEEAVPEWALLPAVARGLPSILRGEIDPLELLFSTDHARRFYTHLYERHARDSRFSTFLELLSHEKPDMRIVEVGAGTGGMTRLVTGTLLDLEARTGQRRFAEYVYTDISPAFFEAARAEFSAFAERISFRTLDVERQPAEQGLEAGSFDVVIAGSVLHATPDLAATLVNVRSLLRPGGLLVLQEVTQPDGASANVSFGCLEGWWLSSEEWRRLSPLLTAPRWDEVLRGSGLFSGSELTLRDYESADSHFSSIIVSAAVGGDEADVGDGLRGRVVFVVDQDSKEQQALAATIGEQHPGFRVRHLEEPVAGDWAVCTDETVVSLVEVGRSLLALPSEEEFGALQRLVRGTERLLWVTSLTDDDDPQAALATGLLRSLRSEDSEKQLVSLVIESGCPPGGEARHVASVLRACFGRRRRSEELEFVVREGMLTIGRLEQEAALERERVARIRPQLRQETWRAPTTGDDCRAPALALEVGTPGMLDTLRFGADEEAGTELGPDEVEVEAEAWPVSFRDVFIALGRLGSERLGFECVGTVTRTGPDCADSFRPGERVVMTAPGCMRSHPRAHSSAVLRLPGGVSALDAVAAVSPLTTAWHALVNVARLRPGESVLIHAAAGGTGQMAVAVARFLGARIIATVGSEAKRKLVTELFDIPAERVLYSRDTSFAGGVRRLTDGRGVDVVLNSLSGDMMRASWECIGSYGRFIELGKADIMADAALPMGRFAGNVSFAAVDLHHIALTDRCLTRSLLEKALELLATGAVGPPAPLHRFAVSEVEKAFRLMQSGRNTGRIVISLGGDDVVTKRLVRRPGWRFRPDASYLVAGGLGGIGRAVLRWMARRGARNLMVPSRSAVSTPAAAELVAELESRGVRVATPCCDVACPRQLAKALADCEAEGMPPIRGCIQAAMELQDAALADCEAEGMPPIRGCIQAAMELQDAVFDNMGHSQWTKALRPKTAASWNLHRQLPADLDFLILLSSLAGVYGTPGQANYAAGCSYQDALSRARPGAGLTLDLGWMRTIGIVAEAGLARGHVRDMQPVEEADLLSLLEHCCDPARKQHKHHHQHQLLVGVVHPARFLSRGQTPIPLVVGRRLFAGFSSAPRRSSAMDGSSNDNEAATTAALFARAPTKADRSAVVAAALTAKLAHALDVSVDDVDPRRSLADYGVDSLMAVELRNWFRRDFGAQLSVFDIMGRASIGRVCEVVVDKAAEY
ncbi:hypothetical protein L249_8593 [Ophiocordyceps polyrhachis-furcata BCC 54312]|uniref:Uncharacterized protein n=1 Tax=Ophiocordyceps polyrhachis-furcata BCC 54312 TaxID=1330021 RepID=A0A367L6X0_9HYPO|nr:hypothetical protein L249_8593 [Ophiocordyceps polyrhachis-furcata BCC 54312]